ncbi:peptide-methionine (R)-S-oxide reductase, partial [Stenotrophomonas maltophilia]
MSLSRRHLLGLGGVATAAGLLGLGACSRAAP